MNQSDAKKKLIDAILGLEGALAIYAILTNDQELVDRWSLARNEYMSLLTWLENER